MSIFRGRNGEIQQNSEDDDLVTRKVELNDECPPISEHDEINVSVTETGEAKTQLLWRSSDAKSDAKSSPVDALSDPVVGWLVIVEGHGKGHALQLSYGMNSIGRNKTERICLNFGDEEISRNKHAIVTYDPRGRKFYVQHGGGKNLSYLGEQPLLVPAELHGGEEILLGQTTLRFVPFCGEDFDWQNDA